MFILILYTEVMVGIPRWGEERRLEIISLTGWRDYDRNSGYEKKRIKKNKDF